MLTGKLEREQNNAAWVKAFEARARGCRLAGGRRATCRSGCGRAPRPLASTLDDDAVQFIVDRTEGNLLAAQQELEKLKLLRAGRPGGPGRRAGVASVTARASTCSSSAMPRSGGDVPRGAADPRGTAQRGRGADAGACGRWRARSAIPGARRRTMAATRAGSGPRPALETAKRRAARLPYARLAARLLARRPHDQGPASRRCLGRNGAADRRIRAVAARCHSPEHAPLEYS